MIELLRPDWDAPASVCALSTTRHGGCSQGAYRSLNLADHVGDDPGAVRRNRQRLLEQAGVPGEPLWLNQVHGRAVCRIDRPPAAPPEADAAVAFAAGAVCAVMTADCLPVLLCDQDGTAVAAAHAGWRGLAGGVLEATVAQMARPPASLRAWLGPAIGRDQFEVGDEVRAAFCAAAPRAEQAFRPSRSGRWLADLPLLARQRLEQLGVGRVAGGEYCTASDAARFFSYRRDGATGRMASLIWLAPSPATPAQAGA
jgi:hypothetical protein